MQTFTTREELLALIPKQGRVAELGVFRGEFAATILRACDPAELVLIDMWDGAMVSGDKDGNNIVEIPDMRVPYKELVKTYEFDPRVILVRETTQRALAGFPDGYFDFVYVDADHSYQGEWSDLVLADAKVGQGGLIGGHDYTRIFPGVIEAVDKFCREYAWTMVALTKDGCPSYLLDRT